MTITIGDAIPSVDFKYFKGGDLVSANTADLLAGKTAIVFGVPAAFSPTCTDKHVPGFLAHMPALREKGVDLVMCVSVNDPFVMRAWGNSQETGDHIMMMPDGNGAFTAALGLDFDMSAVGAGTRSKRYGMIVRGGKVTHLAVEDSPGEASVSTAEAMLEQL